MYANQVFFLLRILRLISALKELLFMFTGILSIETMENSAMSSDPGLLK